MICSNHVSTIVVLFQTPWEILAASVYYLRKFPPALCYLFYDPIFLFFHITSLIHQKSCPWKDFYPTTALVKFSVVCM